MNRRISASIFLLFTLLFATTTPAQCNTDLLAYYGLTGSPKPIPYRSKLADMQVNLCPKIDSSCCLAQDFNLSLSLWDAASRKIVKLLRQYFALLQGIAVSQRLIIPFLPNLLATASTACKRIDTTYFKSPIAFDQIHLAIKTALETFAFLQRGFYCMICDADNHPHFTAGAPYGRLMVALDREFCPVLINQMRDFLAFKIYYFDPMVINMNAVIDCADGLNSGYFDNSYRVAYDRLNACLSNDEGCDELCNEFRLGSSSSMFVGKLGEYRRVLGEFHRVIKKYNPKAEIPVIEKELDGEVTAEFFAQKELNVEVGPLNTNLSRYDVLLRKGGLNPFEISADSKYEYQEREGQQVNMQQTTVFESVTTVKVSADKVQAHVAVETGDKLATLEANDLLPQPTEISSMTGSMDDMETQFQSKLMQESNIDPNDMRKAGIERGE